MNRRSRRHSQKSHPFYKKCTSCTEGMCEKCIDVVRSMYADDKICTCKKSGHGSSVRLAITQLTVAKLSPGNEAHTQQIMDPISGVIHAPGLTVSPEGEVKFRDEEND